MILDRISDLLKREVLDPAFCELDLAAGRPQLALAQQIRNDDQRDALRADRCRHGGAGPKPLREDQCGQSREPLSPKPKRRRRRCPGRPPLDNRTVMAGLLFVLKPGIAWEDFPQEMGCCGMTLLNRLRQWQEAGVWR